MFQGYHQNRRVARTTIVHAYLVGRVDIVGLGDTVLVQVLVVPARLYHHLKGGVQHQQALAKRGQQFGIKGEQKVYFFVFPTSLAEKSKTNCIFHFVG